MSRLATAAKVTAGACLVLTALAACTVAVIVGRMVLIAEGRP